MVRPSTVAHRDALEGDTYRWPLAAFAIATAVCGVVLTGSLRVLGPADGLDEHPLYRYPGDWLLGARANWDGFWYTQIAIDGYSYHGSGTDFTPPAFFPGYPMLMRAVMLVTRDAALAGIVISVAAGAVATCFLHRWAADRYGRRVARTTVIVLLLYPYSLYLYGVVYADALFLASAVTAFVALEKGYPFVAGLLGIVACATRLVGVAVAIGLILRLLEMRGVFERGAVGERRVHLDRLRPRDAGLLLPGLGTIGYCAYLWATFGNPLLFQESGKAWGQGEGLRTLFKGRTVEMLTTGLPYLRLEMALQLALLVGALLLTRAVWRRFGWAYGCYVLLVLGIPLVTVGNLFGAGRYVLPAFPCFVVVGAALADRPQLSLRLATVAAALLVVFATFFSRGLWVS